MPALLLNPIPIFQDNYLWVLVYGQHAVMVDPGDFLPAKNYLQAQQLTLTDILITHNHADHIGGLEALMAFAPQAQVWRGGSSNAQLSLQCGLQIERLYTPGHTRDHVCYFLNGDWPLSANLNQPLSSDKTDLSCAPILFSGDTLFSAGCGRVMEDRENNNGYNCLFDSLTMLSQLPPTTRVCCSHEYTLANLNFSQVVEPENPARDAYRVWAQAERTAGRPTLPSTLAQELAINPFLRCADIASNNPHFAQCDNARDTFYSLRRLKDDFRR